MMEEGFDVHHSGFPFTAEMVPLVPQRMPFVSFPEVPQSIPRTPDTGVLPV